MLSHVPILNHGCENLKFFGGFNLVHSVIRIPIFSLGEFAQKLLHARIYTNRQGYDLLLNPELYCAGSIFYWIYSLNCEISRVFVLFI